ncbi:ubiquitin-protein ligase [Ceratobasidium sp. AG-Ba]|nr:ubiquitin-protein ligase [Ceratobasidium sp. AG-Ba]
MPNMSRDEEYMYNWTHSNPQRLTIPAHGSNVITALLISHGRIISASDDREMHVYSSTTGKLVHKLTGHEGGIWTLAVSPSLPDVLVSGATDSTIRFWNLATGKCTHIFGGHAETVRCLKIVTPSWIYIDGEKQKWPKRSLVVTGSRDRTLRVWKLPRGDGTNGTPSELLEPESNPCHIHELKGHTDVVRDLAVYKNLAVSASYDTTVKVWNLITAECKWTLEGHTRKVYSVAIDQERNQVVSGAMDGTARIWSLETGQTLYTLTGHLYLVNLTAVSTSNIVTAASDATVRVWNPSTGALKYRLEAHTGAITCFQHDERKILTGSDGKLIMWDIKTGEVVKEMVKDITGVWQVAYEGDLCVAAASVEEMTYLEVWNFAEEAESEGGI